MGTTATLEADYWPKEGKKESYESTDYAQTWTRWFPVPTTTFETLMPTVGSDTDSTDTDKIVAKIDRQDRPGREGSWMIVTYVKITRGAFSSDYAETRRVDTPTYHTRVVTTYGVAKANTSSGIPAEGDHLDGGTANFDPICNRVEKDNQMWPGLIVVIATWEGRRAFA